MLKPIIVLSQMSAAHSGILGANRFWEDRGFYPVWCAIDISKINSVAEKSELFFLIAPEHLNDSYYAAVNYLRDLCLEEEKTVYQYGNESMNAYIRKAIPSLFLRGCYLFPEEDPGLVLSEVAELEREALEKKGFLIISRDMTYSRALRIALANRFNVFVTSGPEDDLDPFIADARCLLLALDVKGDFLEMIKLRNYLRKARKDYHVHIILLAENAKQQLEVTRYLGKEGLCLNKEMDVVKNARYLVKRYDSYTG